MRRFIAGVVGPAVIVATWAFGAFAKDATYESMLVVNTEDSTVRFEQTLSIPLSRVLTSIPDPEAETSANRLFLRHTVPTSEASWGGVLTLEADALSARLFVHEPHDTTSDPFRLVHGSVRDDTSIGAAVSWTGSWPGHAQYVSAVPLRGLAGPLVFAQVAAPAEDTIRLSTLAYGTERLRHHFLAVDGRLRVGDSRLEWGVARQTGVELHTSGGLSSRDVVDEGARFARMETSFGRHRIWLLVHDTDREFRSLAASSYPFRRGATGIESRWQWRPATNRLLSVYGERILFRDTSSATGLEVSFSSMPRRAWGWRVGWEGSWVDSTPDSNAWNVTVTNPDRRLEQAMTVSKDAKGDVRRRIRLQWNEGTWFARLSTDDRLPGWRLEWRWTHDGTWETVVVYKQRTYTDRGIVSWFHVSLTYHVPDFGQVWIRWREPDQGRLDVGWTRPETLGAGVSVFF